MVHRACILTDGVSDLPYALAERYRIKVLPVYVMLDGRTYLDNGTLDRSQFYAELGQASREVSTAAPAPEEFLRAYEELASEGAEEIIGLFTASAVSSIYDHAVIAAQHFSGARVHVVDSTQVSMGLGWMAIEAAELLEKGASVQEVLDRVRALRAGTRVLGVLPSTNYLRRSGRVGWVASHIASLLKIKPLIAFEQSSARLLGKARTYWRGVRAIIEHVRDVCPLSRLAVLHSGVDETVIRRMWNELMALCPGIDIPVVGIGPVFATHVGPGCLGVALVEEAASPALP